MKIQVTYMLRNGNKKIKIKKLYTNMQEYEKHKQEMINKNFYVVNFTQVNK